MSLSRLIEWDANTGMAEAFHETPEGDFFQSEVQDVQHILDYAKVLSDQTPGKEWRHSAFVPAAIWNRAVREGWVHDKKAWKKWANDPENKLFRTWPGRL
jgi:hypothetical protein